MRTFVILRNLHKILSWKNHRPVPLPNDVQNVVRDGDVIRWHETDCAWNWGTITPLGIHHSDTGQVIDFNGNVIMGKTSPNWLSEVLQPSDT
jgi:hypothetical protein